MSIFCVTLLLSVLAAVQAAQEIKRTCWQGVLYTPKGNTANRKGHDGTLRGAACIHAQGKMPGTVNGTFTTVRNA